MQDTLDNTKTFIFWASDPMNLLKVRAVGYKRIRDWVVEMKRRGIRLITIDPVYTETAAMSDEWIPIRAGGDSALMAAMAYVMIEQGLHDSAFIDTYTVGFEPFRQYLMGESDGTPKTPEWAADKTDMSAEKIRALAMEYATTKGVKIASARGIQRNEHGEQQVRMLIALATIKGEFGLPGGGLGFEIPGSAGVGDAKVVGKAPASFGERPQPRHPDHPAAALRALHPRTRPSSHDHDGKQYAYPEPGKSELKLLYWAGGSALNQHDDINLTLEAFKKIETIIVQDSWWTPASRHADIVLPINTLFERNDMTRFWRYVVYQHKIIESLGESRSDFEVFRDLADRLGFKDDFTTGLDTEDAWLRKLYESADYGLTLRGVPRRGLRTRWTSTRRRTWPSPTSAPTPARTRWARLGQDRDHSETIASYGYDDCPATPQWIEPTEWLGSPLTKDYPLQMMNKHPLWRRHSSYDNVDTLHKDSKINGYEPVWINPADAATRGIATGDVVRVFNGRGSILCAALVTDRVRSQTVVVQEGSWFSPIEPGTIGSIDRGGCGSVLTRQIGKLEAGAGSRYPQHPGPGRGVRRRVDAERLRGYPTELRRDLS